MSLFPGQVEKIVFDLDQVESLASPIRNEVFWAFAAEEPASVSEVAHGLDKSPQTVHYHVAELVRVGLLLAVDERKRRSRTEKLYVRAAVSVFSQGRTSSKEYRRHALRGFAATTRTMVRETEKVQQAMDEDPSILDINFYRRITVRVAPEKAKELKERLSELLAEVQALDGEEGSQVHFAIYMRPTIRESRRRLNEGTEPE